MASIDFKNMRTDAIKSLHNVTLIEVHRNGKTVVLPDAASAIYDIVQGSTYRIKHDRGETSLGSDWIPIHASVD